MVEGMRNWVAIVISVLAMAATSINAYFSHSSFELNRETQHTALRISSETQRTTTFSQFQQQYTFVFARFPKRILDPTFRPKRGSDAYARLESYWLFCFSEWYATNKLAPDAYKDLWTAYYAPLVMNALGILPLRNVLQDMMLRYNMDRGDYRSFFLALTHLARYAHTPFAPNVEERVAKSHGPG